MIDVKFGQVENAFLPILVKVFDNVIDVKLVQPENEV